MINTYRPARVEIYDNTGCKTAAQVKTTTGCDLLFNGGYFGGAFQAFGDIRINGKTISKNDYTYTGYGWNNGELPRVMSNSDMEKVDNFFSCLWVLENGNKLPVNDADKEVGGSRGRTGWGLTPAGEMVTLCTSDGVTADRMTLSAARNKLAEAGCVSATLNDGGGSSSGIFPTGTVYGDGRAIRNYICVWLEKKEDKPVAKKKICLDPGHGLAEAYNQSPDGTYKEYEFTLDMGFRLREHLMRCGLDVMITRQDDSTPGLTARATMANIWGADLFVSLHSNADNTASCDKAGWGPSSGFTAWIYDKGGERERAANLLIEEMREAGIKIFGQGVYTNKTGITVLKATNMPAILPEYLFHTNRTDVPLLKDGAFRAKLAEATAKAIVKWCGVAWVSGAIAPVDPEPAPSESSGGAVHRVYIATAYEQRGAFSNADNADSLCAELIKQGHKAFVISSEK